MISQQNSIREALLKQACVSLRDGSRFQFRVDEIGGQDEIRKFINKLTSILGENVRANCGHGLLTVYSDERDGTTVVVATIKRDSWRT